jgi:aldehyde dehydrogenase (NAD+)
MDKFSSLGLSAKNCGTYGGSKTFDSNTLLTSISPVDGLEIGAVSETDSKSYDEVIKLSQSAFQEWRKWPAPKRGEIVRQFGDELRKHKDSLGYLVSYEMGKSLQEGLGEVQEMIDICDFAVGLSRQLYGLTMHSERPGHRMYEQWHPLGVVGIISAFNFPVAVWAWNSALAWVCGNTCVWKGSEKTPLCAIACQNIWNLVAKRNNVPDGVSSVVSGGADLGKSLATDRRVALVSATGSTRMGRAVAVDVAERFGKVLLELGGNNAIIVTPSADLKMTIMAAVFGACGTAGQRCTTTRRLIVHDSIYSKVIESLKMAYSQLSIGSPLDTKNHVGPLIDRAAVQSYLNAVQEAQNQGCKVVVEAGVLQGAGFESGCYVRPCILEAPANGLPIVQQETFAPILYVLRYSELDEAIEMQNGVNQGLSSSIMTLNMREAEKFLSAAGSDCGIANVNIGTSGAEIGGAFGGEKETGGGRESGSDAWKNYMRRQTNTINYSDSLPLAQGIVFEL